MSLLFNKATRGAAAAVISSLALAGTAFAAFQSGEDVGVYCANTSFAGETKTEFSSCCNGGCGSIHPGTGVDAGYTSCMDKCNAHFVSS